MNSGSEPQEMNGMKHVCTPAPVFLVFSDHRIFGFLHRALRAAGNRLLPKTLVNPRAFVNSLFRTYGPIFSGKVINVSGWDDRDGEGGTYRTYFPNISDYTISNAPNIQKGVGSVRATEGEHKEIAIDLDLPIPNELQRTFDVVFNISTLEHVFAIDQGFEDLCTLSRDAVLLSIPVIQQVHIAESYGDYWRMTTLGIARKFLEHGFTPLVIAANDQPFAPVYCFALAVRDPDKYRGVIDKVLRFEMGGALYGSSLKERFIAHLLGGSQ
jgi:hypothetical protein